MHNMILTSSFPEYAGAYWQSWLIEIAIMLVVFLILVFNWKRLSRLALSNMIAPALVIWVCGVILYSLGFAHEGSASSIIAWVLRAFQASLMMFVSDNELVEVSPYYKENTAYMICFSLVHFSAVLLSAILLLNTFGFKARNYMAMLLMKHRSYMQKSDCYVFWGFTDESVTLARDVASKRPDANIIFVRSKQGTTLLGGMEVGHLLSQAAHSGSQKVIEDTESIPGALVTYCRKDIKDIFDRVVSDTQCHELDNILDHAGLSTLRKILDNAGEVHHFLLTPDENLNLIAVSVLSDDRWIAEHHKNIHLYAMSKDFVVAENANVKIINPAYLSCVSLRLDVSNHPVNCIDPAFVADGRVDDSFVAMIVGCGSTGCEVARFLYEYSAFAAKDGSDNPRRIILVDKDVDRLCGELRVAAPTIFNSDELVSVDSKAGSAAFWDVFSEYVQDLGCICIALGDDTLDMELAQHLYKAVHSLKLRVQHGFKIFLRVYSVENESRIMRFASYFNEFKDTTGIEIVPFGSISSIFSYDVIVASDILDSARIFNKSLDTVLGKNLDLDVRQAWDADHDMAAYIGKYHSPILAADEMNKKIEQCFSESLHIGTLLALAGIRPDDKAAIDRMCRICAGRRSDSTEYPDASPSQQALLDNLAHTAFRRLVSLHALSGYKTKPDGITDPVEIARLHYSSLVTTWAEASPKARLMAYDIVDTSFIIASSRI